MSIAKKTHNQVFRVLQVLPAPRLGKIASFSLKTFGLRFLTEIVSRTHVGVVIDVVQFHIPQVVDC